MKDLWPVTTSSPSGSLIVVVIALRSEPTCGSVSASAAIASSRRPRQPPLRSGVPPADRDRVAADALHGEQGIQVRADPGQQLADHGHGEGVDPGEAAAELGRVP